jgi:hypothetical protein
MAESDRTASLMSPARLAQMNPKTPATPAAWLNQMAADAGHQHVKRIGELGELLQEQATSTELSSLATRLEQFSATLPTLDFSLLEPRGWWARTTGKGSGGGAEFADLFEQINAAAQSLIGHGAALRKEHQADSAVTDRALVELDVEYHAMEKILEQGARWLQDMRNQLKVRQTAATDLQSQRAVIEDANRCDILVTRLKLLRSLCNAAVQVQGQVRENAARRLALTQTLQQSLASELKTWHGRLSAVASVARGGKSSAHGLHGPMEAHQELQSSVTKAASACHQLLQQEQALAQSLMALSRHDAPSA